MRRAMRRHLLCTSINSEQVLNDRAYTAEAVKKLFAANAETGSAAANGRDFRAVGLLADYAEVAELL